MGLQRTAQRAALRLQQPFAATPDRLANLLNQLERFSVDIDIDILAFHNGPWWLFRFAVRVLVVYTHTRLACSCETPSIGRALAQNSNFPRCCSATQVPQ